MVWSSGRGQCGFVRWARVATAPHRAVHWSALFFIAILRSGATRIPTSLLKAGCRGFMPAGTVFVANCRGVEPVDHGALWSGQSAGTEEMPHSLQQGALIPQPFEHRTIDLRTDNLQHPGVIIIPPTQVVIAQQGALEQRAFDGCEGEHFKAEEIALRPVDPALLDQQQDRKSVV